MTAIVWDEIGSRTFQTGVSKGVIYLPDGGAVPWNGLTSVEEASPPAPTPYHLDGVKYMDRQNYSDFSLKVTALTYPDELDALVGNPTYGEGLQLDGQRARRFGFVYRTDVGNDIGGAGVGYKLHIVYNALATPGGKNFATVDSSVDPLDFDWQLDTRPLHFPGYRPTAHFVVDTTRVETGIVDDLEEILFGTPSTIPRMPTVDDLLTIFHPGPAPDAAVIDDVWTMTGEPEFFTISSGGTEFAVRGVKTTYSDDTEYTMESE